MATSVDALIGTLLVGSWLDSALFAILIMQGFHYFGHYDDGWVIRTAVALLYLLNIIELAGEYATIYLDAVTHFGEPEYLQSPEIAPRTMYLVSTQLIAFIVQSYLITRIHRLSGRLWLSVILFIVASLALSGGLGLSIINSKHSALSERKRQQVVTAIWLAGSAILDVVIAGCLVYLFQQVRKTVTFPTTRSVLTTLMSRAVESGSITAALAIAAVGLFYGLQRTNWAAAFVMVLGRAYSVTFLYNLNIRAKLHGQMRQTTHDSSTSGSLGMGRFGPRGRFSPPTLTNPAEFGLGVGTPVSIIPEEYRVQIQVPPDEVSPIENNKQVFNNGNS